MAFRRLALAVPAIAIACTSRSPTVTQPAAPAPVDLESLAENQVVRGFRAAAVYLDGNDAAIGARFVHQATGFVLDYLRIESAPQGFLWVGTFPTSDRGEPHTQEHLLLGKGNRGRLFGSVEAMSLADSSAFTMQWRTCYHFHTVAGHDVFWPVFENQLDALLNPDYSDEEIRREVANFGVSQDPDGSLRLEEKGTVYTEMVRSYEAPNRRSWEVADHLLFGADHPLALSSGGRPDDIRAMTPADIRTYHREHYYLGNMGMVGAFPRAVDVGTVLDRTGALLRKLGGRTGTAMTADQLPPPRGAAEPRIAVAEYPHTDSGKASPIFVVWPATRQLPLGERRLLELFADAVAGDESTSLYKRIVDSRTRTLDVGATGVWSWVSRERGQPVYIGLEGVAGSSLTESGAAAVRAAVTGELARIAALPAGDPELAALNERVKNRLISSRRSLAKFLDSPPGFGFRGTGSGWMEHLLDLETVPGFRKSLTLGATLDALEKELAAGGNPWTSRLAAWGLLATPHAVISRPSPALRQRLDAERTARLDAELARLAASYGTTGAAATLQRFRADYDTATAALDAAARGAVLPPFIDRPPLTVDDDLRYQVGAVAGVPLVASRFDSMISSRVSLAFRLDAVPESHLVYLALLPDLLTDTGLVEDGVAIASEDVKEALRREILSLSFSYTSNARTGRVELVASGAGNDVGETRRAIGWLGRLATHPDWRAANLPRLRDVVDQALTAYRNVMLGPEEHWVEGPATIYWRQQWPLLAHTGSFLTQLHDLHRLRWQLADGGDPAVTAPVAGFLRELAPLGGRLDRPRLIALAEALEGATTAIAAVRGTPPKALPEAAIAGPLAAAGGLPAPARALIARAGADLRVLLADIPDDALAADWAYLCRQMATDLEVGSAVALARLDEVRRAVFQVGNARAWLVGSTASGPAIEADLAALVGRLGTGPVTRQHYRADRFIDDRLRARRPDAAQPRYVGLVNPSTQSGVFVHSAPGGSLDDTSDDAILDYLAGNLFSGSGGHSLFMKTWAAGLAYSNGIRVSLAMGRIRYYAERCPELPQTLRFVIGELRAAKPDPQLVDYAVALAFSSRIAASYESRARGIADDLVDGTTPELVRAFRSRLLAVKTERDQATLGAELFRRMEVVYGRVLPGYGPAQTVDDAVYMVIGPATQLDAWASYLAATVGADATLHRLYPRDFWVPAAVR
jgi:Zn-dependent M16 (insulinase) family peptidase